MSTVITPYLYPGTGFWDIDILMAVDSGYHLRVLLDFIKFSLKFLRIYAWFRPENLDVSYYGHQKIINLIFLPLPYINIAPPVSLLV